MVKKGLSSFEIRFLVGELDSLKNARVDKVYKTERKGLLLQLHRPGIGKALLLISAPGFMYITSSKGETPEKPSGFCMLLRKHLSNSRIEGISQIGSERIVRILFRGKEQRSLIVELFSKGNILLCDEDDKILGAAEQISWSEREVRTGYIYKMPAARPDPFGMGIWEIHNVLEGSDSSELVKALAISFGLGGVYAEELCARAGVDKKKFPKELSRAEVKRLFTAISGLRREKPKPNAVIKAGKTIDIVPVELKYYGDCEKKAFKTYSEALDSALEKEAATLENPEIARIKKMIAKQEEYIASLAEAEAENRRKGELIYEKYIMLKEILEEAKEARKNHALKDIRKRLKQGIVVRSVDEANAKISIEL